MNKTYSLSLHAPVFASDKPAETIPRNVQRPLRYSVNPPPENPRNQNFVVRYTQNKTGELNKSIPESPWHGPSPSNVPAQNVRFDTAFDNDSLV